jgi:hypothetical protein
MDVDRPKRVFSFLGQIAQETRLTKGKAQLDLVRKRNEKVRNLQKRRKQRERLRKMAKNLEFTEAQLQLNDEDIKRLESFVEEGTDGEVE